MDPMLWLFITTAVTIVFVIAAVSPIQTATEEAIRNSAMLEARRFVSIINILQTAPDGTVYEFDMPNTKCNVLITENAVRLKITFVSGQEISETIGMIKTKARIARNEFDCRETRKMKIKKNNGVLSFERA